MNNEQCFRSSSINLKLLISGIYCKIIPGQKALALSLTTPFELSNDEKSPYALLFLSAG
jgi:hypothetical protein